MDNNGQARKVGAGCGKELTADGRDWVFQELEEQAGHTKKHQLKFHSIKSSLQPCTDAGWPCRVSLQNTGHQSCWNTYQQADFVSPSQVGLSPFQQL